MGQFGRHGQLAEKPPCLVQMPRCDAGARLHGVDTNRTHAAFEHMEQRRQSCRVVGDLAGHVAHVEQFAAGRQHGFDLVMKIDPHRFGVGCQHQHGGGQRAVFANRCLTVQDRAQATVESGQRRPVVGGFGKGPHALRRYRPGDQKARHEAAASRQPLIASEECPQRGFLYLQRHRQAGTAHGEAVDTAPRYRQRPAIPQHIQGGQIAHG